MIDTKKLRELAERATPGPWRECGSEILIGDHWWRPASHEHYRNEHDAAFIAAVSSSTVTALLDEIERLQEIVRHDGEQILEWKRSHAGLCTEVLQLKAALETACDIARNSTAPEHKDVHARIEDLRKGHWSPQAEDALACLPCGSELPNNHVDNHYVDGQQLHCPECGSVNQVSYDTEDGAYINTYWCVHGRRGDEVCTPCDEEAA